jgi:hypothetical protein
MGWLAGTGMFPWAGTPRSARVEEEGRVPLLTSTRKAEEFARLLEGSGRAGSGSDLGTLQNLAARLSSVPQPRPEFASALRQRLMSEATSTLPSAAGGAAGTGTGAGSGTGTGSSASGSSASGSAGSAVSSATTGGGTAAGGSTAGSAMSGSAVSAVLGATAPVWAQFTAVVAATAITIGGLGLGASKSLPGEPLYGVKRQIEQIQLDLAGGRTDTAFAQLGFAHARLSEIADLLAGRNANAALPADLQKRVSELLSDWAYETSRGTTALLDQLSAASGDVAGIRRKLTDFTDSQARELALVVQRLPDQRLQSLTGSAFAYLQRVDTALGNPVDLATLLPSLGLPLPTSTQGAVPNASRSGTARPDASVAPKANTPGSVPTLPIPTNGSTPSGGASPGSTFPSTTLPNGGRSLPGPVGDLGGGVSNTVTGASGGVGKTVSGVLNGVTGKGPGLVLPTSVPSVPGAGH